MFVPRLPFPEISSSPSFQQRQEVIRQIRAAIKGSWDDVVKIYEAQRDVAHKAKITKMGYTALHIAVSDGEEDIVEKLVKTVSNVPGALEVKNNAGNTPLHIAAATGNIRMCRRIVGSIERGSQLVKIQNNDGETPLFMAALHGKKDTFLYLNSLVYLDENISSPYVRRTSDGNTILHCAIEGEYLDLAFQRIHLYKADLVNSVNEEGITPLHVLATKPSAFRSGCKLGPWRGIIYECKYGNSGIYWTRYASKPIRICSRD
ncbi:Ankyrin repeat, PH and SEC7 domain containing protein secG [Morus notabilis]|uniref:Ankyrin repeat, PH and SEC7 domain containing protein secG n=1 Tax=Morus notabilis TaxID=981085 RepID=W9R5C9_9ROSA|nr:Ankyrin repeat, PH and SEC7 domain containing protein secG [Morus notabilis]